MRGVLVLHMGGIFELHSEFRPMPARSYEQHLPSAAPVIVLVDQPDYRTEQ